MKLSRTALLAAFVLGFLVQPVLAQPAEEAFYRGKTMRIIVGFGPGGGYDAYARLIAPYLSKVLDATVIVENQPGAGGMAALNRLTTSDPDGLRIMLVQGVGAALSQIIEVSGMRYDLAALGHLGTVSASPWMWIAGPSSTFKTPQEALSFGKPMLWGGSASTDGSSDGAAFTCEALRIKCRVIIGYRGSNEAALAVAKGEMDAVYVSDTSALNFVKGAPELRIIATMNRKPSRLFPETKTIFELLKLDEQQAWLLDFHSTVEDLGRILVTTPNVPPARLDFLRKAIETTLKNPALIEEGERSQRYIDFIDAETTRKRVLRVVAEITPEQTKMIQALIGRSEAR